jgi:DNA replication protein DnaC
MSTDAALVDPTQIWAGFDQHEVEQNLKRGAAARSLIPPVYQDAVVENPDIRAWAEDLIERAVETPGPCPGIFRGPSLLLLGAVGTGKTWAAWGALRALLASGAGCRWEFITEAGLMDRLRPRPRVDSVEEFERYANTGLLVIDDLGASKDTEWASEKNYQLLDYRCAWNKPTIITSNIPPRDVVTTTGVTVGLATLLGERVVSRMRAMVSTTVVCKGPDRRSS